MNKIDEIIDTHLEKHDAEYVFWGIIIGVLSGFFAVLVTQDIKYFVLLMYVGLVSGLSVLTLTKIIKIINKG